MTLWGGGPGGPDTATGTPAGGRLEVSFSVVGVPVQQGSMRACVCNGRAIVRHDKGKALTDWRLRLGQAAAATGWQRVLDGPVGIDVTFVMQRPRAHYGARGLLPSAPRIPATTPDIDKLCRAVLDALTGVLFTDDRQVAELVAAKVFAADDEAAGVHVTVGRLGV